MRILVADDDENGRIMLQTILEAQGYTVDTAYDGANALEVARQTPPDLIVSDVLMPEMDGFSFCRAVKMDERLKNIPFIFYSAAYTDAKDEQLAAAAGASRYILKPMEPADMVKIIADILREYEAKTLDVPMQPQKDEGELQEMHEEVLSRQLDKKLKELEEKNLALQQGEEKYRRIFEGMQDNYILADLNGTIRLVNPATLKTLGYGDEDELIGETIADRLAVDKEDIRKLDSVLRANGQVRSYEIKLKRKSGEEIVIDANIHLILDDDDQPISVEGLFRDITERKKNENTVRQQLTELQGWYDQTLGREDRILELKCEVNELLRSLDKPDRYSVQNT